MAKNAAGFEIPDGKDVVGTQNNDRLAFMQAINDRNDEARAGELQDVVDIDQGITEPFQPEGLAVQQVEQEDAVTPPTPAPQRQAAPQGEEVVAAPAAPQRVKLVVNGVEQELELAEVIKRAQKVSSADEYLRQAAEARKAATVPAVPVPSLEDVRKQQREDAKRIVQAIQMGEEEEAIQAVLALQQPKGPSQDDLVRTVDDRLSLNQAVARFQGEYPEIYKDPLLRKLAEEADEELVRNGDRRPYWERFNEIGQNLRGWVQGIAPQAPAEPEPKAAASATVVRAAKQALKAAVQQPPKATSAKPQAEEDEPEETPAQIIARMAAARGGNQTLMGMRGLDS